ncbi:MAG: acylphosphatase [Gammaproteobacteria bacterium]|nr:acylphosphatase [Gammaproteobacteria bacterium]
MAVTCKRYTVTGRVQGVFFRASTRETAERLGMSGWARNLPNGHVEVVAYGDEAGQEALLEWLQHGPPYAQVESVASGKADDVTPPKGFTIR